MQWKDSLSLPHSVAGKNRNANSIIERMATVNRRKLCASSRFNCALADFIQFALKSVNSCCYVILLSTLRNGLVLQPQSLLPAKWLNYPVLEQKMPANWNKLLSFISINNKSWVNPWNSLIIFRHFGVPQSISWRYLVPVIQINMKNVFIDE